MKSFNVADFFLFASNYVSADEAAKDKLSKYVVGFRYASQWVSDI